MSDEIRKNIKVIKEKATTDFYLKCLQYFRKQSIKKNMEIEYDNYIYIHEGRFRSWIEIACAQNEDVYDFFELCCDVSPESSVLDSKNLLYDNGFDKQTVNMQEECVIKAMSSLISSFKNCSLYEVLRELQPCDKQNMWSRYIIEVLLKDNYIDDYVLDFFKKANYNAVKSERKVFKKIFEIFSKCLFQKSETFCLDNPYASTDEQKIIFRENKRFKSIENILKIVEALHCEDILFDFLVKKFETSQELVSRLKEIWVDSGILDLAKKNMDGNTLNKLAVRFNQIIRSRLNIIYNSNPDISLNSKRLHMLQALKMEYNITDKKTALQILSEYDFKSRKIDIRKKTRRK